MQLRSFPIQLKFPREQKMSLELSICSRDIWKTALKKMREKKSWEFSTFLSDSREKKLSTNQI